MNKILLLAVIYLLSTYGYAQNGENDPTFNPDDIGYGSGFGFEGSSSSDIEVLDDGKILVVGEFVRYNNKRVRHIVKLNPDGYADTSFNSGAGFDYAVNSIAVQDDGKIIAVGDFSNYNLDSLGSKGIMRLNADGSRDYTFSTDGGVGGIFGNMEEVYSVAIQSDDKILIGGFFDSYGAHNSISCLARINTDGSLDTAFTYNLGTGLNLLTYGSGAVHSIAIQDDGKILVGGEFTSFDGVSRNRIARLNSDGTLDTSFDPGFGFDQLVLSIEVQINGKILVGGSFISFDGTANNKLVRLNPDGTKDASFNLGTVFNHTVSTVKLQNNGKILVGGDFTSYNGMISNRIVRLNSDGSIDNTFNNGTSVNITGAVITLEIQDDDKILLGGTFHSYNDTTKRGLVRINENGSNDIQFNKATGIDKIVYSLVVQPDKKIIVAGRFREVKYISSNHIARLNLDGELDTTFNIGTGFHWMVNSLAIQDDGKIIAGGELVGFNGVIQNRITRLNSDGSLDLTFDIGTGFDNYVKSIAVQDDGKILVGGYFSSYDGFSSNKIIRLNPDGSHDASFSVGQGIDGYSSEVLSIFVQNDGKILVGGAFTSFDGISCKNIVRLNADGSFDNTFDTGSGFDEEVNIIKVQDNGRILVGGYFSNYDGNTAEGIIRLNSDGTQDQSFDSGSGLYMAQSIVIQNNGKITVGGVFNSYNGIARSNIVRLHNDGSIDESFEIGTGFDGAAMALAFQDNDKLIVGGDFVSYNGIGRNRIARLFAGCVDASVNVNWSTLTANNSDATYQWVDCDNNYVPILNETSQVFNVTQDGKYAVIVTSNTTNCVDTSACINIQSASLNESFSESNLSIFPNPNNGSFTIETDREAEMVVYNSIGRKISSKKLKVGQNSIYFENAANGIYYLNIVDKKGDISSQKVSVMR